MSQSNRVKVTIIGCGGMARHHIRRMLLQQEATEIAVVCEPSPDAYAATAEISRSQLWQWLHNNVTTEEGTPVTAETIHHIADEELARMKREFGDANFDAMLVDKNLPGIDGLELIRRVHKVDKECEAVIVTGYASLESALSAVDLGAADYLTKPLPSIGILPATLKKVLRRLRRSRWVKAVLTVMRCIHVENRASPRKEPRLRNALMKTSCVSSSARAGSRTKRKTKP